jgi:hypothetical protein
MASTLTVRTRQDFLMPNKDVVALPAMAGSLRAGRLPESW